MTTKTDCGYRIYDILTDYFDFKEVELADVHNDLLYALGELCADVAKQLNEVKELPLPGTSRKTITAKTAINKGINAFLHFSFD